MDAANSVAPLKQTLGLRFPLVPSAPEVFMNTLSVVVHRHFTANSDDVEGKERFHRERAQLIHSLAETVDLTVEDWGNTDSERPREIVEIIVALGSAGAFTALVAITKAWIERRKIPEVELKGPNGTIRLTGATADDAVAIARQIGFTMAS